MVRTLASEPFWRSGMGQAIVRSRIAPVTAPPNGLAVARDHDAVDGAADDLFDRAFISATFAPGCR